MSERAASGNDVRHTVAAFPLTEWGLVIKAGQPHLPDGVAALEKLCRAYWPALYAFLRQQGHAPPDAQDLTQAFFARLLEHRSLSTANPARGHFRSFLLGALKHFLADQQKARSAQRRGGGQTVLSLNDLEAEQRYRQLPASDLTPDRVYDLQWAWSLLEQTLVALRDECERFGQTEQFELLKPFLTATPDKGDYTELAKRLRLKPGAVAVMVHRLRQRYRALVRREVTRTLSNPTEVEDELEYLFGGVSR